MRLQLPEPENTVILISSHANSSRESGNVMQLLADRCRENHLLPLSFYGNSVKTMEFCRHVRPFAAVIYYWNGISEAKVEELVQSGTLTVVISSMPLANCCCPIFWADAGHFMRVAVEELRKAGHDRIGYFGEFGEYNHYTERKNIDERSRARVRELGRVLPEFTPETDTVGDCYGNLDSLGKMLRKKRHTAWICENLALAKQLYCTASELGIRIPEDLSVICFGHFNRLPPRWDFPVRFATVGTSPDEIADRIDSLFRAGEPPEAEIITLKPLIERGDTIAPAREPKQDCKGGDPLMK